MADENPFDLVLEHLKRIQAKLSTMEVDLGDLKIRMSSMEQYQGQVLTMLGGLNQRMDRCDERMARIERRPILSRCDRVLAAIPRN